MASDHSNTSSSPSLTSMTGFARLDGQSEHHQWTWEMRSVNSRGLEVRCRLPMGFDDLELSLRKKAATQLSRGSVNINLTLKQEETTARLAMNRTALADVVAMIAEIQDTDIDLAPPSPEGILTIRGVIESCDEVLQDDDRAALINALETSFADALDMLVAARQAEGMALVSVLSGQVETVSKLAVEARQQAEGLTATIREKLLSQIKEITSESGVSEERIAQEVTMLAVKADIREEIDRLDAHIEAAHALLAQEGPVGRKFDFLVQEFNREANTLCSKVPDINLKKVGLEMKTVIEQMREQIQNVE